MNRRLGFDNASIGLLWLCYALSFCFRVDMALVRFGMVLPFCTRWFWYGVGNVSLLFVEVLRWSCYGLLVCLGFGVALPFRARRFLSGIGEVVL